MTDAFTPAIPPLTAVRLPDDDVACLVQSANLSLADEVALKPRIAIVRKGQRLTEHLQIERDTGWFAPMTGDLLRQGISVVANDIPATRQAADAVNRATGVPGDWVVQQNLYVTPGRSQGFDPHCDPHIVVVAHLYGEKEWTIFEKTDDNPVYAAGTTTIADKNEKLPVRCRIRVRPGDMFWIPRGVYHSAVAKSTASVHLAIGAVGVRPIDYVWAMAQDCLDRSDLRADMDAGAALDAARAFVREYGFTPIALPRFPQPVAPKGMVGRTLSFQEVLDAL